MANEANTTGFTGCPEHLEVWRKNAARQGAELNHARLLDELVDAAIRAENSELIGSHTFYDGMLHAYALLTGTSAGAAEELVNQLVRARKTETVASRPLDLV